MSPLIFIIGRQPLLSRAELAAVFPSMRVIASGREFIVAEGVELASVDLRRLGGVVKVGEVFGEAASLVPDRVAEFLADDRTGDGKLLFGASVYPSTGGGQAREKKAATPLQTLLIGVKKKLKEFGIGSRFANKNFTNLSSAQVELAVKKDGGTEVLAVTDGRRWWYAATAAVQPFDEFKTRDYAKAVRDARVGMLPPKLAQMMVNLGTSVITSERSERGDPDEIASPDVRRDRNDIAIYDPFCGTGTVLLEAALMGHAVVGSDVDARMVDAARVNLSSLNLVGDVFAHDASRRPSVETFPKTKQTIVVSEGYLGPAVSRVPELRTRTHIFAELVKLYAGFFGWVDATRIVITLPAYVERGAPRYFASVNIRPIVERAGWREVRLTSQPLVYFRPDQIVAREVTVWERT